MRRAPGLERVRAGAVDRRAARVRGHARAALRPARGMYHPHHAVLLRPALGDGGTDRRLRPRRRGHVRLPPPPAPGDAARRARSHLAAQDARPPDDARGAVRDLPGRVDRPDPSRSREDDAVHRQHHGAGAVDAHRSRGRACARAGGRDDVLVRLEPQRRATHGRRAAGSLRRRALRPADARPGAGALARLRHDGPRARAGARRARPRLPAGQAEGQVRHPPLRARGLGLHGGIPAGRSRPVHRALRRRARGRA